jgi:hypothetical protein
MTSRTPGPAAQQHGAADDAAQHLLCPSLRVLLSTQVKALISGQKTETENVGCKAERALFRRSVVLVSGGYRHTPETNRLFSYPG